MSAKVVIAVGALCSVLLLGGAVALELALRASWRARYAASERPAEASERQPSADRKRAEKPAEPKAPTGHFFERAELESKLSLTTPQEVRRLLGDPADVGRPAVGLPFGDDDRDKDVWIYHNKTRDPQTGKPDPDLLIWFERGRVSLVVCTPLRTIPR